MRYTIFRFLFAICLLSTAASADPGRYGFEKCLDVRLTKEEIAKIRADLEALPDDSSVQTRSAITIPVYFHIIQDSGNNNPATESQIVDQMNVLNSAYASADISFTLAGIQTVVNDSWAINLSSSSIEAVEMKATLRQGDAQTLNVYLTDLGNSLLGYATFPWDYADYPDTDGIVVLSTSLPGGEAFPYDKGRTVVHEAGHWLGLLHTFQPPSSVTNGCKGSGDWVSDTPAEKVPHYACRKTDSCKQRGADPIRNFMNYTPDACQNRFTRGQGDLMYDMWTLYRSGN